MFVGEIVYWANPVLPVSGDWLACDGNFHAQALYPDLFAVLGATFGVAPPGFFYVPDCRSRVTVGVGTAVALAANDGLAAPGRKPIQHLHLAVGNGANSAAFNVAHTLSDSGPPTNTVFVDTGGATILAGPDHTHTAPAVNAHTFGAHQHANGNTALRLNWPPNQWTWRIIRWRVTP